MIDLINYLEEYWQPFIEFLKARGHDEDMVEDYAEEILQELKDNFN